MAENSKRILVVEDEPALVQVLKQALSEASFEVATAGTGREGAQELCKGDYALGIIDLMLPGIDGFEVIGRVREYGHSTLILVLSARNRLDDKVRAFDLGADDYLPKPFKTAELLARIRALLRRSAASGQLLTCGDLVLDPELRTVQRAGRPITLSPKEYALLELLARHSGKAISKRVLLRGVWAGRQDIAENTVEVYIGYLRQKTEEDGRPRLIATVRGVGYALAEPGERSEAKS